MALSGRFDHADTANEGACGRSQGEFLSARHAFRGVLLGIPGPLILEKLGASLLYIITCTKFYVLSILAAYYLTSMPAITGFVG